MLQYLPNLAAWYLVISFAGLLALPWTFRFFRWLPDRGYTLARTTGLLLVTFVFWFFGSLGIFHNNIPGLLASTVIITLMGMVYLGRQGWDELRHWLHQQKYGVLAVELLFLLAFLGWAGIRSLTPEILGTEKPMEFMFINSILRSDTFPPQDAWLSGYSISYYYFGYLQVASLARLTATSAEVAFNLAQALIFALTALGSLGLVSNLVGLVRQSRRGKGSQPASLISSFWPGLLGPLMVLMVSNFYAPLELMHDNGLLANSKVTTVWYSYGQAADPSTVRSLSDFSEAPGIKAGSINLWEWLDLKALTQSTAGKSTQASWSLPNWFYASRVVHDRSLSGEETEAIDEMPAFSFLLGDLHPHVLALPFDFLAAVTALEWLLYVRMHFRGHKPSPVPEPGETANSPDWFSRLVKNLAEWTLGCGWGKIAITGIILGSLIFLNTWDFPIYGYLIASAVIAGAASSLGFRVAGNAWRIVRLLGVIVTVSLVFYFPFFTTFQSQAGGILPNLVYPTRFQQTVVMFGPVLIGVLVFTVWLWIRLHRSLVKKAVWTAGIGIIVVLVLASLLLAITVSLRNGGTGLVSQLYAALPASETLSLLLQRRLVDILTTITAAMLIAVPIGLLWGSFFPMQKTVEINPAEVSPEAEGDLSEVTPADVDRSEVSSPILLSPAIFMALLMIVTGALLLIGPEFVYLRDNFGTRMNTIFKFYFQVWILWGSAAAFGIWFIFEYSYRWGRWISGLLVGAAVLAGLIYLPAGIITRSGGSAANATLDGMAYFARDYVDDWTAIQWMQKNISGNPVILEGTKGAYWIEGRSSRFSMATGLPTLMGWINHEGQWRGNAFSQVAGRDGDIRTIYQSRDWQTTAALLDKYQVKYVIVTSLEQDWYKPLYLQKFQSNMITVYQSGDVIIFAR
jgi:YYY domain-containing protein